MECKLSEKRLRVRKRVNGGSHIVAADAEHASQRLRILVGKVREPVDHHRPSLVFLYGEIDFRADRIGGPEPGVNAQNAAFGNPALGQQDGERVFPGLNPPVQIQNGSGIRLAWRR